MNLNPLPNRTLEERGKTSLPILRSIINDETTLIVHDLAVESFGNLGGRDVGAELTKLLEKETGFWRHVSARQVSDWKSSVDNYQTQMLRSHYSKTLRIIYQLGLIKFKAAETTVTELRDFWNASMLLRETSSQLTEECAAYLRTVAVEAPRQK